MIQLLARRMKYYVFILFLINTAVFAHGLLNARRELPDWKGDFKAAEESIAEIETKTPLERFRVSVLRARLDSAKSSSSIVIEEYKEGEIFFFLTFFDIVALLLMFLKIEKDELQS